MRVSSKMSIYTLLIFLFFRSANIFCINPENPVFVPDMITNQDTIKENQDLYNGKIWKNLYYMIEEDQFLFSRDFLPCSLTMNNKTFSEIKIKYDLYNDEILTPVDAGGIVQLNKEMVDSFAIFYQNRKYQFVRLPVDSLNEVDGYVNVIYKGKSSLLVKYAKKIDRPTVKGERDYFYQVNRLFLINEGIYYQIGNKRDLLRVLKTDKAQIKNYLKKNKIRISGKFPETYIPLIRYYDSIGR